jgi:hypothetical protein
VGHRQRRRNPPFLDDEWSYREAAGGIPESAREPSPVYPAGRVGTPADPNAPPGVELSLAPPPLLGLVLLHTVRPTAMQKLRIVTPRELGICLSFDSQLLLRGQRKPKRPMPYSELA